MTRAQTRLVATIRSHGDYAEFWPVVNDWTHHKTTSALALRNINRTVAALERAGVLHVDDDGLFQFGRKPQVPR